LAQFVLDPTAQGLLEGINVYKYLNREGAFRYLPFMINSDLRTGRISTMSEITCPPYRYLMTYHSELPDERLQDITMFADCPDGTATMGGSLYLLPTHSFIVPGDYRTMEDVNIAFNRGGADEPRDASEPAP